VREEPRLAVELPPDFQQLVENHVALAGGPPQQLRDAPVHLLVEGQDPVRVDVVQHDLYR